MKGLKIFSILTIINLLEIVVKADTPQLCEVYVNFKTKSFLGKNYFGICRFNNENIKETDCKQALTVDVPSDPLGTPLFTYSCNPNNYEDSIWDGKSLRRNFCSSTEPDCIRIIECDADEAFRKACQAVPGGSWTINK